METTWASLTIPLIVGALIILIPGLIVALAMRQRGVEALGLAAPISVGIFGVSAIFASNVGVRFSFLIPLAFAVILAGLGGLPRRLLRRGLAFSLALSCCTSALPALSDVPNTFRKPMTSTFTSTPFAIWQIRAMLPR